MRRFRYTIFTTSLFCLLSLFPITADAQNASGPAQPDRSYEVSLQVLVGTNDVAPREQLPTNLAAVTRELKPRFNFTSYRLANTYLGRIGNTGSLEYKSVTNIMGQESAADSPSFLEWSLGSLRDSGDAPRLLHAQPFRFGARVPITTSSFKDDSGKPVTNVAYEPIGLTVNRLSFRENVPTLIGNLTLAKTSGTLFLVLTVKAVDE